MQAHHLPTSTAAELVRPLPFWQRFQFSLILFALAILAIFMGSFIFSTIPRQLEQARGLINRQLESVAVLKTEQLKLWLRQSEIALDLLTSDAAFQPDALTQLIAAGLDLSQKSPEYDNMQDALSKTDLFEEIFLYSPDGTVITATAPELIGRFVTLQPYFLPSLQSDDLQPPFYTPGTSQLNIYFTERILGEDGKAVAVLAGRLKLDTLATVMLQHTGLGQTGETYLVSAANNYLLTPSRLPEYFRFQAYRSEGIDRALNAENGVSAYTNYENPPRPVLGAYRWIPELKVALLAEVSQEEALSSILQSRNLSLLLAGILAVAVLIVSSVIAERISAPINRLTQAAQLLQRGDFSQRVVVNAKNEAGVLSSAFNSMAGELERLVKELEQKITEAQEARQRAEEADHLKSAFLANMSHELRTPLNAVINFTKFVERGMMGPVNGQQVDTLGKVVWHGEHLLHLINDVLDMSKIDAGAMSLFIEENINVYDIFQAAQDTAQGLLTEKLNVRFETSIPPDLPTIRADQHRVTQILLNVVSNACKFTNVGYIRLSAKLQDQMLLLTVEDTGPGIPPEDRETVFAPFRQTQAGLRHGSGTGLGMPISKQLAEAHGGKLWFESTVGKGTTFFITLPIHTVAAIHPSPVKESV